MHNRVTHDLDQRHASTVVIDQRGGRVVDSAAAAQVSGLTGVFFDVGPFDADGRSVWQHHEPLRVRRFFVLRSLEVLGHVGVEVVLAGKDRPRNSAVERTTKLHCILHRLLVRHWQRTGKAKTRRTDIGVRFIAERVGAAAKEFRGSRKLDMHFEPNHHLPALG